MFSPSGEQFEIAFADQRAVVVEVGGGLRTYSAAGREMIDGYGQEEMAHRAAGRCSCPWPNRIAGGGYEFAGRDSSWP